jgi:hypothetical protein
MKWWGVAGAQPAFPVECAAARWCRCRPCARHERGTLRAWRAATRLGRARRPVGQPHPACRGQTTRQEALQAPISPRPLPAVPPFRVQRPWPSGLPARCGRREKRVPLSKAGPRSVAKDRPKRTSTMTAHPCGGARARPHAGAAFGLEAGGSRNRDFAERVSARCARDKCASDSRGSARPLGPQSSEQEIGMFASLTSPHSRLRLESEAGGSHPGTGKRFRTRRVLGLRLALRPRGSPRSGGASRGLQQLDRLSLCWPAIVAGIGAQERPL